MITPTIRVGLPLFFRFGQHPLITSTHDSYMCIYWSALLQVWCKYRPHFTQTYCTVWQTCTSVWVNKTRWLPGKWFSFSLPEHLSTLCCENSRERRKRVIERVSEPPVLIVIHPSIHQPSPHNPSVFSPLPGLTHSVLRHDFALCPAQHGMLISRKLL